MKLELVRPRTQVQVHALPKASQSAPKQNLADEEQLIVPTHRKFQRPVSTYNPVDEGQPAAPFHHKPQRPASTHSLVDDELIDPPHHNLPKDGEPVQTVIRQIVKDAETADRYAKYVNRKSRKELDESETTDDPSHGVPST